MQMDLSKLRGGPFDQQAAIGWDGLAEHARLDLKVGSVIGLKKV